MHMYNEQLKKEIITMGIKFLYNLRRWKKILLIKIAQAPPPQKKKHTSNIAEDSGGASGF